MKILLAAAEAVPLTKVGGLGDVAGSLPRALLDLGHDARVVIPHVRVDEARFKPKPIGTIDVPSVAGPVEAGVSRVTWRGLTYYLISGPPIPKDGPLYGQGIEEDGPKFVFFSLAALGLCRALDWMPDVFHANDFHTGAAIYWLGTVGRHEEDYRRMASVLTIHNLPYMGNHAGGALMRYGLVPSDSPLLPDWARDSLLALGILHADRVNAVSPGYARELLTPEFGSGLEGLLAARGDRLSGILNGIDVEAWNPNADRALKSKFDLDTHEKRASNKRALQKESGLPVSEAVPLLGVVSRLDAQKGFDIAAPAVRRWLESGGQFVLLGTGNPELMAEFDAVGREFPGQASVHLRFDAALASRIYAGADMTLIPSRYEPCGLTQMIAMRYGCVPIVRRTGGLADTVKDYGARGGGTGFVFDEYSADAAWSALQRAWTVFRHRARWQAVQRRGMRQDFSWTRSAKEYVRLYKRAVASEGLA